MEAIRKYRVKWAKNENIDVRVLLDWEHEVTRCIKNRVKRCKRKHVRIRTQVFKYLEYVKGFQEHYVLVPADKVASNIIVVCKKYYLDMVLSELTLSGSNTYIDSNLDCSTLLSKHTDDMKRWNISIPSVMQGLPSFYWLPKMHKDPYGARFIAASSKCTTKPLSELLTSCLSLVMIHFKEYCEGIYRNTGIHCFWIINNSQQVISTLKDINTFAKAKHFDSYDFSTLYTSIPHDSLKNNMSLLIDKAFKACGAVYLSVNKSGKCYWAQAPNACMNFNRLELVAMIEYIWLIITLFRWVIRSSDSVLVHQWARIVHPFLPICISFTLSTDICVDC